MVNRSMGVPSSAREDAARLHHTKTMSNLDALDKALIFCVDAHAGQRDRNSESFAMHPIRVSMKQKTRDRKIIALLHDTIEDTDTTYEMLVLEFGYAIAKDVRLMSRGEDESYSDYIHQILQSENCCYVKLADIEDNTSVRRMDMKAATRFMMYKRSHKKICDHLGIESHLVL